MKIIDISPVISKDMAVFPDEPPFSRSIGSDFSKGDNLVLSSITTTLHIGAHTDAPNHYSKEGKGIDECSLQTYIGPCQVIEVQIPRGERIKIDDVDMSRVSQSRVLFKTSSFPNFNEWNEDFNSLSPELVAALGDKGVTLVGIDTPSIDPWDSKALESHKMVAEKEMFILEGVVLDGVDPGDYTLVALPLKIKDADASPVRAILY